MIKTTKEQRQALKRKWLHSKQWDTPAVWTYKEFRKTVQPCFDMSGCVMVHFGNIWLGIEKDGYTHS